MLLGVVLIVGIIAALSAAAAIWLLITGRNLPGILGRGFTKGDNLRLKRAPPMYFRALGAVLGISAIDITVLVVMLLRFLAAPSVQFAELFAPVTAVLSLATGAALVWLFVLAARHRLFRWDKP